MDWPVLLNTALKGGRTYIRGADMLESVLQAVPGLVPPLSLRCHHLTANKLMVDRLPAGAQLDRSAPGVIIGWLSGEERILEIREADGYGNPPMEDYDESDVVRNALVEGIKAEMPYNLNYTLWDNLVALNKKLLTAQPEGAVTWLLTRLDLIHRPTAPSGLLEISMAGPFSHRLVRSKITLAEKPLGAIYFSAG